MKTAKITVTTKNGHTIYFCAAEVKSESGYGRDKYIAIDKATGFAQGDTMEYFDYLDARYIQQYDFESTLKDYFESWYGEHLFSLNIEIEEQ